MFKYSNGKFVEVKTKKKPDADTTAQLDARIAELESALVKSKEDSKSFQGTIAKLTASIEETARETAEKDKYIEELKTILADRDARIAELESALKKAQK